MPWELALRKQSRRYQQEIRAFPLAVAILSELPHRTTKFEWSYHHTVFSACYLQIRKNGGKARISAELEICVIRREKDALGKQKSSGRNDPSPSQAHRIFSGYLPVLEWRIVSQTISGTFADPQRVFLDYLAYFSANLQAWRFWVRMEILRIWTNPTLAGSFHSSN